MFLTLHDLALRFPDLFGKKQINLLARQAKKSDSALLKRLEEMRYQPEQVFYVPIARETKVRGRNHQLASKISLLDKPDKLEMPCFFANPLCLASESDADYNRPSRRVINAGFYVYTFEIDPDVTDPENVRKQVAEQVGWCVGNKSQFETLYQRLCDYADFRLIEMVWSGSKSCHLHIGFDMRHLAATRFKTRKSDNQFPDLPDKDLRPGLIHLWSVLAKEVASHFGIDVTLFDKALRLPEQYRRLPNGIRQSDEKIRRYWQLKEKASLKQMVIASRSRANSRGKSRFFNEPEIFIQKIRQVAVSRKRTSQCLSGSPLSKEDAELFLEQLEEHLRPLWGKAKDHPRPAAISHDKDGTVINFYNDELDQNPSSLIKWNNQQLLIYSKSAQTQSKGPYRLRHSPNEMVAHFLDTGEIVPRKRLLGVPSGVEALFYSVLNPDKEFYELIGSQSPRQFDEHELEERKRRMRYAFGAVASILTSGIHLVHSSEGMGKTHGLMKNVLMAFEEADYFNNRHVFVACQSYDQAEEKCEEFNSQIFKDVALEGVLLESFAKTYRSACYELSAKVISIELALNVGHFSLIEYVYAEQKDVAHRLDTARDEYWECVDRIEREGRIPVIFTVHKVVQSWESIGGTRLWISKHFHDFLDAENETEKEVVREQIRQDFISHHIIYDEVSMDDLFYQHSVDEVNFLKQMVPNYKDLSDSAFCQAYHRAVRNRENAPTYAQVREIKMAGYAEKDLIQPGDTPEPYGTVHSSASPYAASNLRSHFFKPKNWWKKDLNITFLTTEWRPYLAMKFMREENELPVHATSFDHLSAFEPNDSHVRPKLMLSKKAQKKSIETLVADILADNSDAKIISDGVRGARVISHVSARGRNDFVDGSGDLFAIFMHQSPVLYNRLVIENVFFGRNDMVALFHIDQFNQAMGRTLGFRYKDDDRQTICVFNERLWYQFGGQINLQARYLVVNM